MGQVTLIGDCQTNCVFRSGASLLTGFVQKMVAKSKKLHRFGPASAHWSGSWQTKWRTRAAPASGQATSLMLLQTRAEACEPRGPKINRTGP